MLTGPDSMRAVTNLMVSENDVARAVQVLREVMGEMTRAGG